ncbi:MAG: hypothetical protein MI755_16195 [Sphingomonadales bacterium]|nr:hypothetical protein [Sphingomonadales bacterium]
MDRALQVVNFGAGAPPQLMVSTTRGHHASFHYPGYGARPEFEVGPLGPNDELSILSKVMVPADIVIFESMTFTAQVEGNDRLVVEAFGGNFSPVCWEMFDL